MQCSIYITAAAIFLVAPELNRSMAKSCCSKRKETNPYLIVLFLYVKISEKLRMNAKQKNAFSTAMVGIVFNDHISNKHG